MHYFFRILALKKHHKSMDETQSSNPKNYRMDLSQSPRKLVRWNAGKKFNYIPPDVSSASLSTSGCSSPRTWSLDLPSRTSFRIEGQGGDLDLIWQTLGLSGPEDFEIPKAAYELIKNNSSSDVMQRPKKGKPEVQKHVANKFDEPVPHRFDNSVRTKMQHTISPLNVNVPGTDDKGGGINGDCPPLLPMNPLVLDDDSCSSWDISVRLAPDVAETAGENAKREEGNGLRLGEIIILHGSCSFTTSYDGDDDDTSSTTTEPVSIICPNSGSRINVTHWEKGKLLGSGSFGTVYEGISRYVPLL